MKASLRNVSFAAALLLAPALASAQAQAAKATKKADSTAMKHDMDKMKHEKEGMKHDMDKMKHEKEGMKHEMGAMQGKGEMKHDEKSGWKELDAFHQHLMDTWHPAQKGDLKPARDKAAAFVTAAEAWAKSKGPEKCDNADARKALPGVIADAKAYADAVKANGSDDVVKAALKKAHDSFESVAMPCMMAGMKGMDHAPKKP